MKGTVKRGLALLIALLLAVPAFAESEVGADGFAVAYVEEPAIESAAVDPEIQESEAEFLESADDFEADPPIPEPEPAEAPAEEPAVEAPAVEEPAGDEPAGEESAGEESSGEKSSGEESSGDEPAGEESSGEESSEEQPAGEEPAEKESAGEQPSGEAPVEVEVDLPEEADNPEITLDGETAVAREDAALTESSVKPSAEYIDADGKPQMHDALILTDDMTAWTTDTADGWYVINKDITFTKTIVVTGDVHLILSNVIKLTANAGILVPSDSSLTIYAQTTTGDMGALEARSVQDAAIGCSGACGIVTINGGKILAASNHDVGIGGSGGWIFINGGDIAATSEEASGIGYANGYSDLTTSVIIRGASRVVARSKVDKPGIGSNGLGIQRDSVFLYVADGLYVYSYTDDQHKTPIDNVNGYYQRTSGMAVLTTEPKLSAELDGARFYNDTTSIHQWMIHGGTLKLGREIKLGTDIGQIILKKHDYGNSYTLDCNGFGLRSNKAASDASPAITVDTGATLTLTDTSAKKAGYITASKGSGVYIKDGGMFQMSAGNIRGNTAMRGGGVYVCNGGTFAMDGGKITNNTVSFQGGGVYMESGGTFRLSGAPVIADNQGANVYLLSNSQIVVDGALSTDANVGITMQDSGVFTQNFGKYNDAAPSGFFFSDATGLQALKAVGGACAEAKLGIHAHEYRFHQNTNDDSETLTITCADTDCGHQGDATVVLAINRPALTVYGDGKNPNATVDEALLNAAGEALGRTLSQGYIRYYSAKYKRLQSAPTDAGDYIASLYIPNSLYSVLTHYTISKRAASVTGVSAQSRPYDGTTVAQISGAPAVDGILAGDESGVTLLTDNATASFANADAARNKPVTFDGYSLTGVRAHNYDLSQPQGLKADITPKTVGLTWADTAFTYNKTAQQPTATATGLIGNDVCTVTVKGSQINASATAYTATASALSNPNYALPEDKTCAFTIAQKTVGLTWSNTGLTYNGSAQKPRATATGLIGSDKCDVTVTGEGTNAGDYQATASGLSNTNYALPAKNPPQAFNIAPKTVGLTWGTASFTYDGQSHAPTATATGVVSGDECLVTVTGAQRNVGSYTATASALSNANYALPASNTKAFTIATKVAQLHWSDATFTYDGNAHAPECAVTNLETNDQCTVTVTGEKTAAGRYTATASALSNSNYALPSTKTQAFTINPRTVGLTWGVSAFTYNAQTQYPTATATGLIGSDTCTVTVSGGKKDVGAYTATASALSNANYALPEDKTCAFTIAQKTVGLTWSNTSLTYNGSAQKPRATATGLCSGDKCDVTVTGGGTNAGDYQATASGLSNANYALPAENLTQAFNIAPKTVGLTWGTASFTYDGQSHAPTATATGVVSGDECLVTVTGAQRNAGNHTATASALSNANYALPAANTKAFTIATKVAQLQWSDATFTYDGQAHAPECAVTNLETNDQCTVTVTGEKTAAGRYTATASALSNSNYALPSTKTQAFTINPRTVGLTWGVSAFTYNAQTQYPTATATGLIGSDTCTVTVSGGKKDVGDYTATASALSNANYALPEDKTCAFTIAQKAVGLTWSNTGLIYNGSAQKPRATATGLIGSDKCDVTVTGEGKNAGDYQATASGLSNTNYALPVENPPQAFNIAPKTVGLTWGTASFTYDGQSHAPTATATGLIGADVCEVTVTGAQRNAGSHTATASALSNANYALPAANTKAFTIATKVAQLLWSDATFTYDGQAHAPECSVTNLETNDQCTVTVTGEKTAAGKYTATASALSNSNYALPSTKTQAFTISPKPVTLNWSNTELTYNAKAQQPAATASGLVGSDVCTVTVTGGKTNASATAYIATASTLSNPNYVLPDNKTCAFTIDQKTVGLTWSNTGLIYNGSAQKPRATATGLCSGDKCDVTVTGEGTNAGDFQATATGLSNANYALPAENPPQAFNIAPKTVGLTWGTASFTYDGQSHAPTATATGVVSGDECLVTVTGAQRNAGNHTATASALSNANYALPAANTKAFSIGQKVAQLQWSDATFTYDGQAHAPECAVTNLETNDQCTVTVTGEKTAAGRYTATASALSNSNYALPSTKTQAFTISPKPVTLNWSNTELTYNAKAQQPAATASGLVGSDVCTVTVTGGKTNASATAYIATASTLSNPNYVLPENKTCAFTIDQKTVGLTWSNTGLIYNGSAQKPRATATGLCSGDKCDVTVTGGGTNAGDFQATATGLSNTNYALPVENLTQAFNIAPKTVGLTWSSTTFIFDEQSHAPTATATGLIGADVCEVTVTGEQTDVGSYTATATELSNANYALPASNTVSFKIQDNNTDKPVDTKDTDMTFGTLPTASTPSATTATTTTAAPAGPTVFPINALKKSGRATATVGNVYQIVWGGATAARFKSSKAKVATVSSTGQVIPRAAGKTKITFKVGKKKRTLTLTVKDPTIPGRVTLTAPTTAAKIGDAIPLTVTLPAGTSSPIKWTSSNRKVATVVNGVVTFKKAGRVTITATATRGKKKARVTFRVSK